MTRHKTFSRVLAVLLSLMLAIGVLPISVFAADGDVTYLAANGDELTLEEAYTTINSENAPTAWTTGWYVVDGEVTIDSRVSVTGDVKLILKDGANLTVNGGIDVTGDNAFTVYAQSVGDGMGSLTAIAEDDNAGIGGGNSAPIGTITINGGTVDATGGFYGAGIGGGYSSSGGTITINGGTVTATSSARGAGIGGGVEGSCETITINGGTVEATNSDIGVGIGGGNRGSIGVIMINGGTITATGGQYGAGIGSGEEGTCETITINGGTVDATGGFLGAGIGGGDKGTCETITINGGTVTATSMDRGAGIGGGDNGDGGTIIINGGTVDATGGQYGAGIGGGYYGSGGTITITGGTVDATGGYYGAGIGGGDNGDGGEITINGGTVTATGGYSGAGIGSGVYGAGGIFTADGNAVIFATSISDQSGKDSWKGLIYEGNEGQIYGESYTVEGTLTIPEGKTLTVEDGKIITVSNGAILDNDNNGTIINNGTIYVELGGVYKGPETSPNPVQYQKEQVSYLEYDNGSFTTEYVEEYTLINQDNSPTAWTTGWYVVNGEVTIGNRVTVTGDVKLILKDGANLTVNGGIDVTGDNAFTIYAQSTGDGMGSLTASNDNGDSDAGIGGGIYGSGGTITINGGTVDATGGMNGAGIGGGSEGSGGVITINGGAVTANGGDHGAGIGGGSFGSGGTITITGGTVTATSQVDGAGIGGGDNGTGGEITIIGGTVIATGGMNGAGIGGGRSSASGAIIITGGTVTATCGYAGAGIGGGFGGAGGTITITGATVTATGDEDGAGIGIGYDGSGVMFTADGNAVIFATSISDQSDKDNWSGVIFEGSTGLVYGSTVTVTEDFEIPENAVLTIEDGKTLTVPNDIAITNNGTIKVNMGGSYSGDQPANNKVIYQIDWDTDGDGNADDTTYVAYGETPSHANGSKAPTAEAIFTFTGWDPEIAAVTGTATYTALFSSDTRTYTVTLPTGEGYTIRHSGNTELAYNSDFTFTVELAQGYYKTADFAVKANDALLTADADGNYTVKVLTDTQITLEGVAKESALAAPTVDAGAYDFDWTADNVTLTPSATADSGIAYYEYSTNGGTSWTRLTGSSLTITESDFATDYIFRAVSNAGNVSPESEPVTVKIDNLKLSVSLDGNTENLIQEDTLKIVPLVGLSGIAKVEVSKDGGQWVTLTPSEGNSFIYYYRVVENGTYAFRVTSNTGVVGEEKSITYKNIDRVKPVVSIDSGSYTPDTWTNQNVVLTVSNTAANLGDTTIQYKLDGGAWQDYTGAITVSNETDGTVYTFRATSESGVVSDEVSVTVKIDKTAPTGEIVLGTNRWNSFLNTITFGLFFKDTQSVEVVTADGSVAKIEYLIHEGDALTTDELQQQTFTEYSGKFSVDPDLKCVIYVRLTDNAGNVTYLSSDGIVLDGTPASAPTVATNGYTANAWTNENVTLTVSGASALSGIAKYQVSTDNGESWTDMAMANGMATLTVSADTETAYIFRAVSNSGVNGNISAPVTVKIDKTAPAITVSGNTDTYLQNDTVTVSASAGLSGVAKVEVSKDGGAAQDITASYANGYAVTENGTYTFTVTNGAGVTATDTITYDKLDQTKPVLSLNTHGYTANTWTNGDVTLSASNTAANLGDTILQYKVDGGAWQDYTGAITVSDETDGTVYTFRAISESGETSDEVSVTVKIDKTAPDGDITIAENSVKKFIHDVTFGLFFKENVEVAITGTDSGSGIQTIEYYRSAEALTEAQVAALTDWTAYTSAINETAQDAETFVYYVRITDRAGNTTCFASDGVTFDLTNPVITGIEDGSDYYTAQRVQVTDANLASVTLNGQPVTPDENGAFTLAGNTETEYVLVAVDKAGNETTVTVAMHKTEDLRDNLGDITEDNATSDDRETVEDYLDDLKDRLEDENLTDEEKTILEELADEAQDVLDRLDETEEAGSTDAIDQTKDVTSDNVTPEDKEPLEQAKEDIEKALDEFGDNYTDEEKAELEEDLSRIEDALDVIERTEDTEDSIEALPDTVNPDDSKAEEQIQAAKDKYDALTDYEKSLISDEAKDKLEGLLAALCDYRIIEGNGSTWTVGSEGSVTMTANGPVAKFTGIEVDGKTVDPANYTVKSGSTIVTLNPEYLRTLSVGKHTLTILYTDGETSGEFEIVKGPEGTTTIPQTGAGSDAALWITLMLLTTCGLTGTVVYRRKKKYSK